MDPFDDLPVIIKKSKRAKRLALRLDSKERLINLVIPHSMSEKRARFFALDHIDWIEEQLANLPEKVTFEHGSIIPILGIDHKIIIDFDEDRKRTDIFFENNQLIIQTNKEAPSSRIERFLKKLAKEKLTELSAKKAAAINKTIKSVSVRDTKSRWGSCAADGSLSYSWRLIFAPYAAFDYVVAHEIAHLIHLDHSKKFWAICRQLSDDFTEGSYWIRNHGHELMKYTA